MFKLDELKALWPEIPLRDSLCSYILPVPSFLSVFCLALTLISAMHQHLSACLSFLSVCLSCPVLAASTNRAVLAEYIKSIFVSIFVSFGCTVLFRKKKWTRVCLFGVTMIYQMTWLTAIALFGGVFGLFFFFAGNGGLNCRRAVSAKTTKRLSSDSTSRSNLQLSSLDVLLCFVFKEKNATFCVPLLPSLFSFAAGGRTVTYLASQPAYVTLGDKGHREVLCML